MDTKPIRPIKAIGLAVLGSSFGFDSGVGVGTTTTAISLFSSVGAGVGSTLGVGSGVVSAIAGSGCASGCASATASVGPSDVSLAFASAASDFLFSNLAFALATSLFPLCAALSILS